MAWERSEPAVPREPGWERIAKETAQRAGGRCEAQGSAWPFPGKSWMGADGRCTQPGAAADHIINRASTRGLPSSDETPPTQWLCQWHHDWKTAQESAASRAKQRKKLRIQDERPPGLR